MNPAPEVCLVTGGSRGIGAAIVGRLARSGRVVFLNHRNSEAQALSVQGALSDGGTIEVVQADLSDTAAVDGMMRRVAETSGRLDVLVHNAAAPIQLKRVQDLDWSADVEPQLAVACRGFLNCVQAARPLLVKGSRIVVLLSDAVFHVPPAQTAAYVTAKAALWGLTRAVAKEFQSRGVRVHAVSPSLAKTSLVDAYGDRALEILAGQHPMGRLVDPEEIAAVVEALVGEAGAYMHGENVIVNGGLAF